MYDVAIVGAGPAGSTLARLLANCCKVLLIDKRPLADESDGRTLGKCCGGLLAPDAQAMLSRMGLGLPKDVLVSPQLFVVRAIDTARSVERYYQRYYINMSRHRFDRWLLSLVPPQVDVELSAKFRSFESDPEGVTIKLTDNKSTREHRARLLVGADGASSMVRKTALPDAPKPRGYIAIQHWVEAHPHLPYFSTVFDPAISDYYCWTIPKENHLLIGAALRPGPDVHDKFELLKTRLRENGVEFGDAIHKESAFILRPTRPSQISTGSGNVLLAGEAAGFISPSSAEGFSYAFKSAIICAQTLSRSLQDAPERFKKNTRNLRTNLMMKNLKSHFIYNPTTRNLVMRLGLLSMHVPRSRP
jgi:flavin-dependent dehydrogenase